MRLYLLTLLFIAKSLLKVFGIIVLAFFLFVCLLLQCIPIVQHKHEGNLPRMLLQNGFRMKMITVYDFQNVLQTLKAIFQKKLLLH